MGSTLSDLENQEEGIPQGVYCSSHCSLLKLTISWSVSIPIDCSLYIDDFVICHKFTNMYTIERQLQLNLNKINKWVTDNGFRFSKTKTKCVHYCSLRKMHNDPVLKLEASEIPIVNKYKFLSIIYDKKLSVIPHIKYLKNKCTRAQELLKVVANGEWGDDWQTLLKLYRTLIWSQLDYSSLVYRSEGSCT